MPKKSARPVTSKPRQDASSRLKSQPNILRFTRSTKRKAEQAAQRDMDVEKRRRQFQESHNEWRPIDGAPSGQFTSHHALKEAEKRQEFQSSTVTPTQIGVNFRVNNKNALTTPISRRSVPLPPIDWADPKNMWDNMLKKELLYDRNSNVFDKHPQLQARMRTILLDWIIEVCEVYRLHRETFFLGVDLFDRFLNTQRNVQKQQLQLIGITSLFVAAKLEEIYPPKLQEFAFITDGACTENEILFQELIIVKALRWDLTPLTANSWLNCYLQLANLGNSRNKETNFILPCYSAHGFIQIVRLLDLCVLDIESLQFTYSVLATTALYLMTSDQIAFTVSGYQYEDVATCLRWMAPFAQAINEQGVIQLKFFPNINYDETHNIQTHVVDLDLLERVRQFQRQIEESRHSPEVTNSDRSVAHMLTPPHSSKKAQDPETMQTSMA